MPENLETASEAAVPEPDEIVEAMHRAVDAIRERGGTLIVSREGEVIHLNPGDPGYLEV